MPSVLTSAAKRKHGAGLQAGLRDRRPWGWPAAVAFACIGVLVVLYPVLPVLLVLALGSAATVAIVGFDGVAACAWTLAMVFAPLNTVRVTSFATVADVFIVIAALAMVLSRLAGTSHRAQQRSGLSAVAAGLGVIALGGLIGTFFARSPVESLDQIARFVLASLGTVSAFALWQPSPERVRSLCWAWLAGAVVSATWGLTLGGRTYHGRIYGLNGQPNHLGLVCLFGIALALGLAMSTRGWRAKAASCFCFPLAAALFMSGSRAALLGLVAAFGILAVLQHGVRFAFRIALAVGLGAVALNVGIVELPKDSVFGRLAGEGAVSSSDRERVTLRERSFDRLEGHPFTGEGFEAVNEAHNIYIQLLVSAGPLGLIGFIVVARAIIAPAARTATRTAGASERDSALSIGLVAGYTGYLVYGLFQPVLWQRYLWLYVVLIIAVARAGTQGRSPHETTPGMEKHRSSGIRPSPRAKDGIAPSL